ARIIRLQGGARCYHAAYRVSGEREGDEHADEDPEARSRFWAGGVVVEGVWVWHFSERVLVGAAAYRRAWVGSSIRIRGLRISELAAVVISPRSECCLPHSPSPSWVHPRNSRPLVSPP